MSYNALQLQPDTHTPTTQNYFPLHNNTHKTINRLAQYHGQHKLQNNNPIQQNATKKNKRQLYLNIINK